MSRERRGKGTFFATYRRLVDEIRAINPEATIIVCTPRKAYGFNGYLPEHWYLPKNVFLSREYLDGTKKEPGDNTKEELEEKLDRARSLLR